MKNEYTDYMCQSSYIMLIFLNQNFHSLNKNTFASIFLFDFELCLFQLQAMFKENSGTIQANCESLDQRVKALGKWGPSICVNSLFHSTIICSLICSCTDNLLVSWLIPSNIRSKECSVKQDDEFLTKGYLSLC